MDSDALSDLLDAAYPRCPNDRTLLEDAGTVERPYLSCPVCGLLTLS